MPVRVPSLAVGLLHMSPGTTQAERRRLRIGLALAAAAEGYAMVEVFEFGKSEPWDELQFQEAEGLIAWLEVQALAVSGPIHLDRVEDMGERLRLVVVILAQART